MRGILNDDQGGPLDPPGLRMAEALGEVRDSIQRNVDEKKGGSQKPNSAGSATASTEDWTMSESSKRRSAPTSRKLPKSPRPSNPKRRLLAASKKVQELIDRFEHAKDSIHEHMAGVMISFLAGLFVGGASLKRFVTIWTLNVGFACPRAREANSRSSSRGGSHRSRRTDIGSGIQCARSTPGLSLRRS